MTKKFVKLYHVNYRFQFSLCLKFMYSEFKAYAKKTKEEPKKEDNNKNNDNKDIDMKELKEAIDKLTEKVTSLEAELHVAQESLNEVKSIKPTNYDGIQKWITEEFAPDFRTKIDEAISRSDKGFGSDSPDTSGCQYCLG